MSPPLDSRSGSTIDRITKFLFPLHVVFVVLTSLLALLILIGGLAKLSQGTACIFTHDVWDLSLLHTFLPEACPKNSSLPLVLDGIELFLLAPLPPAVVFAVANYYSLTALRGDTKKAADDLHHVKVVIATLMMSIIATDIISRFLGWSPQSASELAEPLALAVGIVLLVALGIYSRYLFLSSR
jgi:hypothetical protein